MYIFFSIFIIVLLFFFVLNHFRKKRIIYKIQCMTLQEKCSLLNTLIEPIGFSYLADQDIFTSTRDAWQRKMGYQSLYNRGAAHFNMVFDYLPIYFNYNEKTWMIQLWKGQYGINTGCEIGVYCADRILCEEQFDRTLFHAVDDSDLLQMSLELTRNCKPVFQVSCRHWWLTGFCMGSFSSPEQLSLKASITFPNRTMLNAFVDELLKHAYCECDLDICGLTVTFHMKPVHLHKNCFQKFSIWFSQWKNKKFCQIFLFTTRPFCLTLDRLLYLYYFLPFAFRKAMYMRCYKKKYMRHCGCRRNKRR